MDLVRPYAVFCEESRDGQDVIEYLLILHRDLLIHYHVVEFKSRHIGYVRLPHRGGLHHRPVLVKIHETVQITHTARYGLFIYRDGYGCGRKHVHVHGLDEGYPLYGLIPVF